MEKRAFVNVTGVRARAGPGADEAVGKQDQAAHLIRVGSIGMDSEGMLDYSHNGEDMSTVNPSI